VTTAPALLPIAIAAISLLPGTMAPAQHQPLPTAPEKLVVLSYNLNNYATKQSRRDDKAYAATARIIAAVDPDIMVLSEIAGDAGVARLQADLAAAGRQYPYATVVNAADANRKLAVLARFVPVRVAHDITSTYQIKERTQPVKRGFAHCVFRFANDYELHIVGAHLKSKVFNSLGQTDMRRYEARQLRYHVDTILKSDAGANVLVVGDLNDSPNSSSINTLMKRRAGAGKRLYDLRPVDETKASWTHIWWKADSYSRHDYTLVSFGLLPEVDFEGSIIPTVPDWSISSDHRPLITVIHPRNRTDPQVLNHFKRSIFMPPSADAREPIVGTRKPQREDEK
jgi:endonuclease/exonuclease/phosphatase family metal-dependent hydrolase